MLFHMVKSPLLDFWWRPFCFLSHGGNPTHIITWSFPMTFRFLKPMVLRLGIPKRHSLQVSRGKVAILGGDWCRSCGCASGSRANCHCHRAPCFWDQIKKEGFFGLVKTPWILNKYGSFFFSTIYHMFSEMRVFNCDFFCKSQVWQSGSHEDAGGYG